MMYYDKKIAVVIPAYNEQQSIEKVVAGLLTLKNPAANSRLVDQLVVCDNQSTDQTAERAREAGAQVVHESAMGYGNACLKALAALNRPDIVVFVDGDHSVASAEIFRLLDQIGSGADLVIGSRALGKQERGAMTLPQKIGNTLACHLIMALWNYQITDLGPFRAVCYQTLQRLDMQDRTFGWTVEMQVKAIQQGVAIAEVPVSTRKRIGKSKISGTVKGVVGAAIGIFGMIFRLRYQQKAFLKQAAYRN